MLNISKQHSILTMCAAHDAHYRAHSGDTLVFETMDCFSNTLGKETDKFSTVPWDRINPAIKAREYRARKKAQAAAAPVA